MLREECKAILEDIAGRKDLRSSDLLMLYAKIKNTVLTDPSKTNDKRILSIAQLPVAYFLKVIVPDMVCDVDGFLRVYEKHCPADIVFLARVILLVKKLFFMGTDIREGHILDRMYEKYTQIETNESRRVSKTAFTHLYRCINLYPLDVNQLKTRPIGYKTRDIEKVIKLVNSLELPRTERIGLLHNVYLERSSRAKVILERTTVHNFVREKDALDRRKRIVQAESTIFKIPPLDILCELSVTKAVTSLGSGEKTEHYYIPNDVTLENGLIYSLFCSAAAADRGKRAAVFFPSPFFVRKWIDDAFLRDINITFVLDDEALSKLIEYHYFEGTYAAAPTNAAFTSFDAWVQSVKMSGGLDFDTALYFACGNEWRRSVDPDRWLELVKNYAQRPVELFALIGSEEFETAVSPFSPQLKDEHVWLQSVSLIPQGINNSTKPRRKILIQSMVSPQPLRDTECSTKIRAYTLNTDLKIQALSQMTEPPVTVERNEMQELDRTVRKLFREELLKRKATGRKQDPAISYAFTPDITIWCCKSYPKGNNGRPRLEAYVCEPAPPGKAKRGYRDSGNAVASTRKHTTRVQNEDMFQWLEEVYPFAMIHPRHTAAELAGLDTSEPRPHVNVRDNIIAHYEPLLKGQNIAIKTLLYMRPDLAAEFAASDFALLSETVRTEIGSLRVRDISPEDIESLLIRLFAEDTQETLYRRYRMLSRLMDIAVRSGYCANNPLAGVLEDRRRHDRLFAQVRRALAKKNFTEAELLRAFEITDAKLQKGQKEYLGVMLRLLTGLESNIVCALTCADISPIKDYGLMKLTITRQLTNDGKEYRGFERLEDYRCIPCTPLMQRYIERSINDAKKLAGSADGAQSLPIIPSAHKKTMPLSPRKMEELSKEVLREVGINDRVVELPALDGGRKETNLNQYGGDFFRENFRYWAGSYGLTNDELYYLMGSKPETTLGRYYCDYLNDASQLVLMVKLSRLHRIFEAQDEKNCFEADVDQGVSTLSLNAREPIRLEALLSLPRGRSSIRIKCENGMAVDLLPVKRKSGAMTKQEDANE